MGWKDAPIVEAPAPSSSIPKWMDAPELNATPTPQPASLMDKVVGSAAGRAALGMASPVIGAAQIGAHVGDFINKHTGADPVVSPWLDKQIQELEASKRRGMEHYGHDKDSVDWMGLIGSFLPGAAIAKGATTLPFTAKTLPAATGPATRALTSGLQGAAVAGSTPTTGSGDFLDEKTAQLLAGGAFSAAGSLGVDAVKGIAGIGKKLVPFFTKEGYKTIADDVVIDAVGKEHIKRLGDQALAAKPRLLPIAPAPGAQGPTVPGSPVTAAEATQGLSEASPLQALEQSIFKRPGGPSKIGGDLARRTQAAQAVAEAMTDAKTAPMRESALAEANRAREAFPVLEKMIGKGEKSILKATKQLGKLDQATPLKNPDALRSAVEIHGVPPKPLVSQQDIVMRQLLNEQIGKRQNELAAAKAVVQSMKDEGLKPLKPDPILKRIHMSLSTPGDRASDVAVKTLSWLDDKLHALKDKHGTIEANDLYMVRKEAGKVIKKFSEETKNFDQKMTAGLLSKIQGSIDDAIEGAGGKGWREYLKTYAADARNLTADIDSKEMMYKPLQKTNIGGSGVLARAEIPLGGGPMLINRAYTLAKWLPKARAEAIEGKVEGRLAELLADSQKFGQRYANLPGQSRYAQIVDELVRRGTPVVAGTVGGQAGRN